MKITLIALGASAGCLLLAGSAMAGPCTAQIDALTKQMASTDAGMGPTGGASSVGTGTMEQSSANPVSPSAAAQVPTTPATGTMNEASQNKATSAQDVQSQNIGQGTAADQASNAAGGNASASEALAQAKMFDQAGDEAACMGAVNKAQSALQTQ